MLVLSRKKGEKIVLANGSITIEVVEVRGDRVKLGITAPENVEVHRQEVWLKLHGNDDPPPDSAGKEAA